MISPILISTFREWQTLPFHLKFKFASFFTRKEKEGKKRERIRKGPPTNQTPNTNTNQKVLFTRMEDHAVVYLEEELGRINEMFENGDMMAFGRSQEKLIQHFEEIRSAQMDLADRQVSAALERMKTTAETNTVPSTANGGSDITGTLSAKEEKIVEFSEELNKICKDIEETNQVIRKEAEEKFSQPQDSKN